MKYRQTFAEALRDVREKKSAFRISYSKQGQHAGFEDADSLQDLQNKAQKLRAKGFTIDKMGRNTSPVKESFALYAVRPFSDRRAPGGQRKKGDKVSGPMTYTQAVSKAKQMNVGSSVDGTKNVEVRPLKEEDDHEVSMAIGQVRVMQERLSTIMSFLSGKGDDYNIEGWVQSYITSAEESLTTIADYLDKNPEVQNEEKLQEQEEPVKQEQPKKDPEVLEKQISDLKAQLALAKQKIENEKNKVAKPEPNPETGEIPLRTGLANAILSIKDNKKAEINKSKQTSKQIRSLTKESSDIIRESDASDKAKSMGLDYMSFGRYGKKGKVTHKNIGGNLTAVDKDEKPIKEPEPKSDEPKKSVEPKTAEAIVQSEKADKAIDLMIDQEYSASNVKNMVTDMKSTFDVIQKMVDSDETEGDAGSGFSDPKKGFKPEVIDTLQSLEEISSKIEDVKDELDDEDMKDKLAMIQGEIEFITDENADHDNYTKSSKVNSAVKSIRDMLKDLDKPVKEQFISFRKKMMKEEEGKAILTDKDLTKKPELKDILAVKKKKKELKVGGKSKIEINPKADIGQYSGGNQVNTGNLH